MNRFLNIAIKGVLIAVFALFSFTGVVNAQKIERSLEATEYLQTNDEFIYQTVHIPVLDITYHEFSADSLVWRKDFQTGDCYMRFANTTTNTTSPYTSKQGYHDDWWVFNFCTCNGAIGGDGSSKIDTIILCSDGVCDTITEGIATINIPAPITITSTTGNTTTDTTHTHELILYVSGLEDVDTTNRADGYVLKYNEILKEHVYSPDLTGGGGELRVRTHDLNPDVNNVVDIIVENGHLTNEGAGTVSIDFTLEPQDGAQDFFRTDTVTVSAGDTFVTFDTPLPDADYIVDNAYALYSNGERQSLSYDSLTANGFRVLGVVDESILHYLVMRNLDTLGLIAADYGRVAASSTDPALGFLNSKVDDSTITVVNNQLHVLPVDSISDANVYMNSDGVNETLRGNHAHTGMPHISNGAEITDLGDGTVSITASEAYLKTNNSDTATMVSIAIPAATLAVGVDVNTTFFIDYNDGSPVYMADTAVAGRFYDNWDYLLFATGVNTGSSILVRNFKSVSINSQYKSQLRTANTEAVVALGDGITVTDEGARQYSTSVGASLYGTEYKITYPTNTSVSSTFTRTYYDGGWQRVAGESTVNNTQYNNITQGLVSLTSGRFTNKWLYYVDDAPSFWLVLDGQAQYGSYTDAYSVTEPVSLPPELEPFYAGSLLMGKFIVQEGKTEFVAIQNPFEANFGVPVAATNKSYAFTSQGVLSGTYYVAGFYDVSATDANLTQGALTQAFGTANASYAAHPFTVAGGAGTVDAGVVGLRVTGTRIEDDGTRTPSYADTIITDITSQVLNEYEEAAKFIGSVVYELIVISGTPTTYNFDFNYGYVKYEDFGNSDFDVNGFEVVGTAGANDANFNLTLIHHNDEDWTYAATGFVITPTIITDLQTVHNTEYELSNGEPFAFKRAPVNYTEIIHGSASEGVIVRIVAGANNSVQSLDAHIGVRIIE